MTNLLSKEAVNTGRQREADLAKFICLVGMVIVHCFDTYTAFVEASSDVQYVFLYILNTIFGAGTFMFCMGIGIAYSRHNDPVLLMKRGLKLFLLGYLLSLICCLSYLLLLGDVMMFLVYLLTPDIMQFAGLALILFGLLRKLRLPDWGIGVVALLLSVAGSFLREIDLGNPIADMFAGLLFGTLDRDLMTGGVFPLLNWFIFVVAGYLFAEYLLRRTEHKTGLYLRASGIAAVILAVYMILAVPSRYGMMGDILRFHQMQTHETVVCLAGAVFVLGIYHALSQIIPAKIGAVIEDVSKNINSVYCIQWVTISWSTAIWMLLQQPTFPDWTIILFGLVVFLFAAVLAHVYAGFRNKIRQKKAVR